MKLPKTYKKTPHKKPIQAVSFVKSQSKRLSRQDRSVVKKTKSIKKTSSKKSFVKSPTIQRTIVAKSPKKLRVTGLTSTLAKGLIRLEKHMAQSGMTSRREAKDLIESGKVTVNGRVAKNPGVGINPEKDSIVLKNSKEKETILFYKPRNIETSKTSPDSIDIHDKFPQFNHLPPVGRLDKDSEGLILLSNDGVLAKIITGEKSVIEKEYRVTVREDVLPVLLRRMENGIVLDDEITKPCIAKKVSKNEFLITLTEGRKHQVRRMANACNLTVTRLVRVRIGSFTIGKMTAGNFKRIPNIIIEEMKK
jgi:23S rRNA pseudouridine2604 synthase